MRKIFKKIFKPVNDLTKYLDNIIYKEPKYFEHEPIFDFFLVKDLYILNNVVQWSCDNPDKMVFAYHGNGYTEYAIDIAFKLKDAAIDELTSYIKMSMSANRRKRRPATRIGMWLVRYTRSRISTNDCIDQFIAEIQLINDSIGVDNWYVNEQPSIHIADYSFNHLSKIVSSLTVLNKEDKNYLNLVLPPNK